MMGSGRRGGVHGKVLYVLPKENFFTQGRRGRVTHALGVGRGLAEHGVPVRIISGPGLATYQEDFGMDVPLYEVGATTGGRRGLWMVRLFERIEDVLSNDPSIRIIIVRYAVSNGYLFRRLFRLYSDRRWVYEVNSLAYHQYASFPRILRWPFLVLERSILRKADHIAVVSHELGADVARGLMGVDHKRMLVVPNAGTPELAELAEQQSRTARTLPGGPVRFAYLGMFRAYYDFEIVLDAFRAISREFPGVQLHFFGDGSRLESVQRRAAAEPSVVFHGRYDLRALIRAGELGPDCVLLLPYRPRETAATGSPIKLFEYMALGRAILASDVGQQSRILQDGKTAHLYDPNDVRSLIDGMRRVIEDPALRRSLGQRARRQFLQSHTWERRMGRFYEALIRSGPTTNAAENAS